MAEDFCLDKFKRGDQYAQQTLIRESKNLMPKIDFNKA